MGALCSNIIRWLNPSPIVRSETPSGVEIVVSRETNDTGIIHYVHLLNHYIWESSVYDRNDGAVPSLSDPVVWLNEEVVGEVSRMVRLSDDREMPVNRRDGWFEICIDRLQAHEVVMIESGG
jgi:hypothetical protein